MEKLPENNLETQAFRRKSREGVTSCLLFLLRRNEMRIFTLIELLMRGKVVRVVFHSGSSKAVQDVASPLILLLHFSFHC